MLDSEKEIEAVRHANEEQQENNSVEEMLGLGITQVPVLKIGSRLLEFADANDWVNKQESAE